jgi:hypothetical protein
MGGTSPARRQLKRGMVLPQTRWEQGRTARAGCAKEGCNNRSDDLDGGFPSVCKQYPASGVA